MTSVLLLEPYFTGSHRAWAEGYCRASRHETRIIHMPGRFWKWRMHGAAVTLARRWRGLRQSPDVVLASDMLDVATFLGLVRAELGKTPVVVYMHENQLAYPPPDPRPAWSASRRRRAARRDAHYAFVNLTSALAADVVWWNSAHNRDGFLDALPAFLRGFPDARELAAVAAIEAKSHVVPLGIDLAALDRAAPPARVPGPTRLVWNHRWEHDKDPETFFRALGVLAERGHDFEVIVLGEAFAKEPPVFAQARASLGERVRHYGYVSDRNAYARWLWEGDVVVSTARHEFFGVAVCEAVYCGCQPVLPKRLAYPELIPRQYQARVLYTDFDDLVGRLEAAVSAPDPRLAAALREAVRVHDWSVRAPVYDCALAALADPVRSRPGA